MKTFEDYILQERTKVDKINSLQKLLESHTINNEQSIGTSIAFKNVFEEHELEMIKNKIIKLIQTLE
jgi:hypothetical protein